MEGLNNLIAVYLIIMNVIGFIIMGIDKRRAIKKGWRISERTLLLIAFIGGGIGSLVGMRSFRHKTKHLKFKILLPLSALFYSIGIIYLYFFLW